MCCHKLGYVILLHFYNSHSASVALMSALPSSLSALAQTNPVAAASLINLQFFTGTPTWFTKLPSDIQTFFLTTNGHVFVPLTVITASRDLLVWTASQTSKTESDEV